MGLGRRQLCLGPGGTEVENSAGVALGSHLGAQIANGAAGAPAISYTQGYNPSSGLYENIDNTMQGEDTYLVLYGAFAASGNTVYVNGNALAPGSVPFQSATQINVSLGTNYDSVPFTVSVSDAAGTSASLGVNGGAEPNAPNASIVKQVTDSYGNTYNVTYAYIPDGEVRAQFSYKDGSTYVYQGAALGVLQSNGSVAQLNDLTYFNQYGGQAEDDLLAFAQKAPGGRAIAGGVAGCHVQHAALRARRNV